MATILDPENDKTTVTITIEQIEQAIQQAQAIEQECQELLSKLVEEESS